MKINIFCENANINSYLCKSGVEQNEIKIYEMLYKWNLILNCKFNFKFIMST